MKNRLAEGADWQVGDESTQGHAECGADGLGSDEAGLTEDQAGSVLILNMSNRVELMLGSEYIVSSNL